MSRQNPSLETKKEVLQRLFAQEFDTKSYVGDFLPGDADKWNPNFHYHQGVEAFRRVVLDYLNEVDAEYDKWKADRDHNDMKGK